MTARPFPRLSFPRLSFPRVILSALMALGLLCGLAQQQARAAGPDVNADTAGMVLHGYDPVAYFTDGRPVPGKAEYTATYNGGIYRFASAAHRDRFVKEPAKYAPQYGGFCAFGTAMGKKFDGDPQAWAIVDDKLYLNLNKGVQARWKEDVPGFITKANDTWPQIRGKDAAEVNKN